MAESTGKHGTGILPVAEEPLGEPAVYGEDRVFAYLHRPATHPSHETAGRGWSALAEAGHPVITIPTAGPGDLGRVFLLAEIAVAVAGWGLQINPFDQPNVQQAKDATDTVLAGYEESGELPAKSPRRRRPPRCARCCWTPRRRTTWRSWPTCEPHATPSTSPPPSCASAIRDATRATTTFGYGPRFLHSTGQFHKGGPRTGRFLQLLHDGPARRRDPGRPLHLHDAQERPGDRRPGHPARAGPAGRARAAARAMTPWARCAP